MAQLCNRSREVLQLKSCRAKKNAIDQGGEIVYESKLIKSIQYEPGYSVRDH